MREKPKTVRVKARNLKPYFYGVWCSIGNGEPFVNEICVIRWSEKGDQVVMMLDTHNFIFKKPDEEIEVVPIDVDGFYREKYANWTLGPSHNVLELNSRRLDLE